jgi:hypothetical protein
MRQGRIDFPGKAKLTGVFHDWGVLPGSQYTNRILEEGNDDLTPDQLILFDVLMPPHPKTENKPVGPKDTLSETVLTLSYRFAFAASFSLRTFVSKTLAKISLLIFYRMLVMLRLFPMFSIDTKVIFDRNNPIPLDRLIYMAYPYCNMFKVIFGGGSKGSLFGC